MWERAVRLKQHARYVDIEVVQNEAIIAHMGAWLLIKDTWNMNLFYF